ncbi:phenylalanine--tRNA ligase subunit beta [Tessaracoccus antarcticus]|uniref:Phenylalanine--tRNA ligase beta subunit n=1 Tax=Tessaracoccus antarcticus TaxID=2479848 RepID=A0A3M0FYN3_9ACTN|nr:phenylalanine--tRNA ligase subunit beta [Tessaracoccus antarcticus]RMB57744.1 phenylalanine--tRNA ligase subunit beta [Tessaracoccus antarcticus]
MKAPVSWLRELVSLPVTDAEMADSFTRAGLTVERVETTGPDVTGPLVIGRVLSLVEEPQKNGKTIRYCRVDVGGHNDEATDEYPASRGIVCGALNFDEGDLVVVALPGAVLPGDFAIAARKTYGHISDGMICAEDEIGLGDDHDGILVIDPTTGATPGDDALDALWSSDTVFDMEVTTDLGYCLSLRGLAREAAIAARVPFSDPYDRSMPSPTSGGYPVELESDRCTSFVALTIEGFDPDAPTPSWMSQRLLASGVRSISLPVDVTNYVMLESGQPLHAYDAAQLQGPIRVRLASAGEQLRTLDGTVRTCTADDLLITDDSGAIGLAGVMGGEDTEVTSSTTAIVLEAAHFDAASVSRTFRRHGLPSEASKRFERTVDPRVPYAAARRAAELLIAHGGGELRAEETVVGSVPERHRINLRTGLVAAILGAPIEASDTVRILEASGCQVTAMGDSLTVCAPSWRPDLHDPYDVVEEVGRKYGYDRIGLRIPVPPVGGGLTRTQRGRRAVMSAVAAAGFTEVLSLPFIAETELDKLHLTADDPRRSLVRLANPLSDTHPYLRTSLLPGLFAAVAKNTSRSLGDLALFEHGTVFHATDGGAVPHPDVTDRPSDEDLAGIEAALPAQPETLAALVCGDWVAAGWHGDAVEADWTHVVAFAETAASAVGLQLARRNTEVMPWHPGRCAELSVNGQVLGFAGELHPEVIREFGLPERTCAVEFTLGALLAAAPGGGSIRALSSFPLAKEDVALIVDEAVAAADVEAALREGAGELLEEISLFDVYRGDQVGKGKKSLAFALRFRADRTLKDAEAATARQAAVAVAADRYGAVQRA